jgi:hypothetical protein
MIAFQLRVADVSAADVEGKVMQGIRGHLSRHEVFVTLPLSTRS